MTKTQTPFFSFSAQGSVGGLITAQKRGKSTLVRRKPLPSDPYSLPQAYQRWLYEDYAYLWTQQSSAITAYYRSQGSKVHLTGFQYWMKVMLTTLPDIVAWYKLDDNLGATTIDSSRGGQDLTIFGASPAIGRIGECLSFDSVNDYLASFIVPSLTAYTLEMFVTIADLPPANPYILSGTYNGITSCIENYFNNATQRLRAYVRTVGGLFAVESTNAPTPLVLFHYLVRYDGATIDLFLDGVLDNSTPAVGGAVSPTPMPMWVGWRPDFFVKPWHGLIDNYVFYNRALDDTEILRHSLRGYPA